ncbi:hypothetical protein AB0H37_00075 [Actinomadura sp. NPDC023710]|uniref:endonuclease/exonuclease/phosphatase family protein n=1 Tax=Actinomadura sp. NPDC023710 TaxID=3158219 RepID=UPI0033F08B7A
MSTLTVATLNLKDGERLDLVPALLAQIDRPVDILCMQEGKEYDRGGQARRYQAEDLLAPLGPDRGFLTRSTRGTLHELVFVNTARIRPVRHWTPDLPDVFHDQIGWLHLRVDGLEPELAVKSTQWAHWSGDIRLEEAHKLTRYATPGSLAIVAGDFNSIWPDCTGPLGVTHHEFEPNWYTRPLHKRQHKTLPPGARPPTGQDLVSDRRALTLLWEAGFRSAGCQADDMTVTVNNDIDDGQGARIDHIVLSHTLARAMVPGSYGVGVSETGDQASDHRLVWVDLNLPFP